MYIIINDIRYARQVSYEGVFILTNEPEVSA